MANTTPLNSPSTALKQLGFAFPFRKRAQGNAGSSADFTDEHDFHKALKQEPSGSYSVSGKGMWHGGIHVTEAGAGESLDLKYGVRCMADGEVVAWRVDRIYPVSEIPAQHGKPAINAPYSTGFALVRHAMEFPRGTKLTFFSLYMHLQDLAGYESDTSEPKPAYWSTQFKVTEFARDKPHIGPNGQLAPAELGLRVRAIKPHGAVLGILPQGAQVSIGKRDGAWGQLRDTHGAQLFAPTAGGIVGADAASGWIFLRTENGGPVVEEIMPDSSLGRVVVPSTPVPIKAGELIGHLGRYDSLKQQIPNRMVHIEVFCGDGIKSFIEQGRTWLSNNGAHPDRWQTLGLPSDPTILRVDKNSTLYGLANKQGRDAKRTGVIQVAALAELAKHSEKSWMETDPGTDGMKLRWWHVDSADVQGKAIDGWVREQNFAGGRVTREFAQKWVDFQTLEDPHDPTHTMFATTKAFVDYAIGADVPEPEALGKLSPLMASIYRALYPTGDGGRAASDLCAAAGDPWTALRMSRLIIKHESEWANPGKWKQLVAEIEKETGPPQAQHEAEQERIEKLVWWDEVRVGVAELPASDVFHVHPIGLVGNFAKGKFQFTLAMMQRMFPHANRDALQEVADELNAHLEAYKLDTALRRTHFFAQVKQETGSSLSREEGFVWKASSLIAKFSYFHRHPAEANAHGYHQVKPIKADGTSMGQSDFEAIANGAYGGRTELSNGDYASGDGWRYRGRGLKQLTGRANYRAFTTWHASLQSEWAKEVLDFEANPDLLVQPKYAARSAAYFWVGNNLPSEADKGATAAQVNAITAIVNRYTDSYAARVDNFTTIYNRGDFN